LKNTPYPVDAQLVGNPLKAFPIGEFGTLLDNINGLIDDQDNYTAATLTGEFQMYAYSPDGGISRSTKDRSIMWNREYDPVRIMNKLSSIVFDKLVPEIQGVNIMVTGHNKSTENYGIQLIVQDSNELKRTNMCTPLNINRNNCNDGDNFEYKMKDNEKVLLDSDNVKPINNTPFFQYAKLTSTSKNEIFDAIKIQTFDCKDAKQCGFFDPEAFIMTYLSTSGSQN
jgi:hypothetical protein